MLQARKSAATRERILCAANRLFHQHGYQATGLDDLLAAAGVTKGCFYHHFETKEQLAVAALDWHRELALAELDVPGLLALDSPRAALRTLLSRMVGRARLHTDECRFQGCFFGNFALELGAGHAGVRRKLEEIFQGFHGLLRELIERAVEAGELSAHLDRDALATTLLATVEGAVLLDKAAQSPQHSQRTLAVLDALLAT